MKMRFKSTFTKTICFKKVLGGFCRPQSVKKVEVQEALPPARVIGAAPLTLVPQHFPRKPAQRCLRATAANLGFFDRLWAAFAALFYKFF